jgi:hypothetical protein
MRSAQKLMWHLFGLFWPLAIAQSHTRLATVLVNELDAGQLQGARNGQVVGSRHRGLAVGQLGAAIALCRL